MEKISIQITSGQGPEECEWVVAKLLDYLLAQASENLQMKVEESVKGTLPHTLLSVNVSIEGKDAKEFVSHWKGSILWVGQSMYRKHHKRKNWFVGVNVLDSNTSDLFDERLVTYSTMKASGPGGQHVNKTESAVRALYKNPNLSVVVSEARSQFQNKKIALERLKALFEAHQVQLMAKSTSTKWQKHHALERGKPVQTFEGLGFKLKKEVS